MIQIKKSIVHACMAYGATTFSITTLSLMTLSIMSSFATLSVNDIQQYLRDVMLIVVILSVAII